MPISLDTQHPASQKLRQSDRAEPAGKSSGNIFTHNFSSARRAIQTLFARQSILEAETILRQESHSQARGWNLDAAHKEQFRHPRLKSSYSREEREAIWQVLSVQLLPDEVRFHPDAQTREEKFALFRDAVVNSIRQSWKDAKPGVRETVSNALDLLVRKVPISEEQRDLSLTPPDFKITRTDGTPVIFHLLEVAFKLNASHNDADAVIAGLFHDAVEDGLYRDSRQNGIAVSAISQFISDITITGRLSDKQRKLSGQLAHWAAYHVAAATNPYEAKAKKVRLARPSDCKGKNALRYLLQKYSAYSLYIDGMQTLPYFEPRLLKLFDSYSNVCSLKYLDPKKDYDKIFNALWKAMVHIDRDKKLFYDMSKLLLGAIGSELGRLEAAWPDMRETLATPNRIPISEARNSKAPYLISKFPYQLFAIHDYHLNDISMDQEFYEHVGVVVAGPRTTLGPELLSQLPYSRSSRPVAVVFAPTKRHWVDSIFDDTSIEIQFPGFIGDEKMCAAIVLASFQKHLDDSGIGMSASLVPSMIRGPIGEDFIILRLRFNNKNASLDENIIESMGSYYPEFMNNLAARHVEASAPYSEYIASRALYRWHIGQITTLTKAFLHDGFASLKEE